MAEEQVAQHSENIEELKKALEEEKQRAAEYLADAQRERADYRNLKKRTEQEKQEYSTSLKTEFIRTLLPVLDDMEHAFSMVDPASKNSAWIQGFRMIQRKLQDILTEHGCTVIECVGQPFDPSLHEAVAYEEGDEGMVIAEHRKGYTIKDKIIRAPQVTVGKGKVEESGECKTN